MLTFYICVCNECETPSCKKHDAYHLIGVKASECPPKAIADTITEDEVLTTLGYTREECLKHLKTDEMLKGWIESLSFS